MSGETGQSALAHLDAAAAVAFRFSTTHYKSTGFEAQLLRVITGRSAKRATLHRDSSKGERSGA